MQDQSPRAAITTVPANFVSPGWHPARCIRLIELGTIWIVRHHQPQVRLTFEFPLEPLVAYNPQEPERLYPKMVSQDFASRLYNKSHLKRFLTQWVGEEAFAGKETFDPFIIVGEPCMVRIRHGFRDSTQRWYEEVEDITKLTGAQIPDAIMKTEVLTYNDWDQELFNNLPQFVKNKMMGSIEYQRKFPEL